MDHTYIKFSLTETLIPNVEYWYIELDSNNHPCREIGFNRDQDPIAFYPNQELPHGFLSDSPISLNPDEWDQIDRELFETIWKNKDVA